MDETRSRSYSESSKLKKSNAHSTSGTDDHLELNQSMYIEQSKEQLYDDMSRDRFVQGAKDNVNKNDEYKQSYYQKKFNSIKNAISEVMPEVYNNKNSKLHAVKQKQDVYHNARGTKLMESGDDVIEIQIAGSGFKRPIKTHKYFDGLDGLTDSISREEAEKDPTLDHDYMIVQVSSKEMWKLAETYIYDEAEYRKVLETRGGDKSNSIKYKREKELIEKHILTFVDALKEQYSAGEGKIKDADRQPYDKILYGENYIKDDKRLNHKYVYKKLKVHKNNNGESSKVKLSMAGPLVLTGALNLGEYQIDNLKEYTLAAAQTYLKQQIITWYEYYNKMQVALASNDMKEAEACKQKMKRSHVLLRGHSRGAVASSLGAMKVKYWLETEFPEFAKWVDIEVIQMDPVPGFLSDHGFNAKLDYRETNEKKIESYKREKMMPLGDEGKTTVMYSMLTQYKWAFTPQKVKGANRIILMMESHSLQQYQTEEVDGKRHQRALMDISTGEKYRGTGINELPDGVYIVDEKNQLIRMTDYKSTCLIMDKIIQSKKNPDKLDYKGQEGRFDLIKDVVKDWFEKNSNNQKKTEEQQVNQQVEEKKEYFDAEFLSSAGEFAKKVNFDVAASRYHDRIADIQKEIEECDEAISLAKKKAEEIEERLMEAKINVEKASEKDRPWLLDELNDILVVYESVTEVVDANETKKRKLEEELTKNKENASIIKESEKIPELLKYVMNNKDQILLDGSLESYHKCLSVLNIIKNCCAFSGFSMTDKKLTNEERKFLEFRERFVEAKEELQKLADEFTGAVTRSQTNEKMDPVKFSLKSNMVDNFYALSQRGNMVQCAKACILFKTLYLNNTNLEGPYLKAQNDINNLLDGNNLTEQQKIEFYMTLVTIRKGDLTLLAKLYQDLAQAFPKQHDDSMRSHIVMSSLLGQRVRALDYMIAKTKTWGIKADTLKQIERSVSVDNDVKEISNIIKQKAASYAESIRFVDADKQKNMVDAALKGNFADGAKQLDKCLYLIAASVKCANNAKIMEARCEKNANLKSVWTEAKGEREKFWNTMDAADITFHTKIMTLEKYNERMKNLIADYTKNENSQKDAETHLSNYMNAISIYNKSYKKLLQG